MRRNRLWLVIVVAALAVAVEGLGTIGTWAWDSAATKLGRDANAGAAVMIDSALLDLPSSVLRSRRLVIADLTVVDKDRAVMALEAVARRQIRCMVVHPEGYLNLARAGLIRGRVIEGQTDLTKALDRDPTSPFAIRLLGLVKLFQGRFEEALDLLAQAEAVAPGYRLPLVELTAEDDARVQLEGLDRRLTTYPRLRVETLISIGQTLRSMGRTDEADQRLEEVAGDPRADLVRAQWALNDGDAPVAAGLAQGLAQQRRLPAKIRAQAWSILSRALGVQGDSQGALAAAQRSLRLAPRSAEPHLALARIAQGRGDVDEAVNHLRRAWGMDPSNAGILFHFAQAAERAGLKADARLALERAVDLDPGNTATVLRLVDFQLRTGALMEATMTLSRALDRAPADPNLLRMAERLRREVTKR
ncbi:MAG: tetratricopeptide repeat protein [Acidobacteriota bacterium]